MKFMTDSLRTRRAGARHDWRRSGSVWIMAALLGLGAGALTLAVDASPVAAQDAAAKEGKKSDIPDKPKALQREESAEEKEAKKKEAEALRSGPSASRDDFEVGGRDPQEVKRLQEKIRSLNMSRIEKIDRILTKDPTHPRKADMLFQKAELTYEVLQYDSLLAKAEWLKCLEAADQGTVDEKTCAEPKADYTDALDIYKEVLQQFPDYPRLDEVIFRLGDGLMKAGKKKEAVSFLTRLVKNYPKSKYLPDAHLAIAEFWFDQNLLTPAKLSYEEVLKFKGTQLYDYAQYKLAWVLYNQKEYREAVNTFKRVVESVEKDPSKAKLSFANQALNDLIVSWVEIEGGWKEARDYFLEKRDKKYTKKKLRQMASLYDNDGKNEPRIEIFSYLLDDDPLDSKAPDYWEAIIDAKKKVGVRAEWESAVREMIGYFDPKGKWWGSNGSDKRSSNNARMLAEGYLAQLATEYHSRAQKDNDQKLFVQAAKDYKLFLEKFPDSDNAYDIRFYYAEILYDEIKDYVEAAEQYKLVIAAKEDGEHAKHCQFALIKAYENLVLKEHVKSVLVRLAGKSDTDEEVRLEAVDANKDKDLAVASKKERSDLFKWEVPFVEVSDLWAKVYPKEENTPTVMFVAAEIFRSHGQYDKAVPRYEHIINFAPKHRFASYAGNSLLECNNELGRWEEIERWARYLMDNKIFDVTPKDKLQSAIAYAINQKATDLSDKKQFDEAAEELLRLAKEFSDSDLAPGALFNAAAIYERGDKVKLAVKYYEELIKNYPKHELAPEAIFVMGAIFEARTDFETAATYFERLGDNKDWRENFDKSKDAIYNAGVIREALEQWDSAIKTYERFMKLYPKDDLNATLAFHIGELYEKAKKPKDAARAYTGFTRKFRDEKDRHVQAYLNLGLIALVSNSRRAEKEASDNFSKAYSTWQKLEDEDKKKKTKDFAAEARFQLAEMAFKKYESAPLSDLDRLETELVSKGELLAAAETIYFEVIDMRSPMWASAAAYRIGQMYKLFSDGLYNYPIPEGLPPEYEDAYRFQIDEASLPLQEKALKGFQFALNLALELNAYNDWSSKSAQEMSRLEEATYPLTKQEGVEVEHTSEIYLRTDRLSMDDIQKRADAIKKVKASAPAPPAPKSEGAGDAGGAQ